MLTTLKRADGTKTVDVEDTMRYTMDELLPEDKRGGGFGGTGKNEKRSGKGYK